MDQAFRVAEHWRLGEEDEVYFMKLVENARSGDHRYRAKLKRELAELKALHENLAARLAKKPIGSSEREMTYYSSWHWSAIHVITSIPHYQSSSTIAARLGLPEPLVLHCLEALQTFGLVEKNRAHWKFSPESIHLPKTSPLNAGQHANWRSRAVLSSQNPADDGVHFTVVQSMSQADFEKVKQLILGTIDAYFRIAGPSKEEEIACFTCDFFRV